MKLCVTGSGGLIGGEVSAYFAAKKHSVYGLDNNMRADFFGPRGDISWRQKQLKEKFQAFIPVGLDIRDRAATLKFMETLRPDVVVHCAAQPSHDLAASRPFDDFDVNAVGTLNMLESVRRYAPEAVFVHMSTNKVYGDAPNEVKLKELPSRWEYDDPAYSNGIAEDFRIDRSKHSIFGASKVAGDIMVHEYGRYFGIRSCCQVEHALERGCFLGYPVGELRQRCAHAGCRRRRILVPSRSKDLEITPTSHPVVHPGFAERGTKFRNLTR